MLSRSSCSYSHSLGRGGAGGNGRGLVRSDDSFKRLQDGGGGGSGEHGMVALVVEEPWRHKALVKGGAGRGDDGESKSGVGDGRGERGGPELGGIRVRTTVTVTEKVDWLDDLY